MATIKTDLICNLNQPVAATFLHGNLFSQDNAGNTINVYVMENGEPATIGGTVSANVIRADGNTVAVSGAIDGNKAYVILPQACYAVPGRVEIIIKLTQSTTITTIAAIVANVYRSTTDTVVDPGTIIPSISSLIAEIEEAVDSIPVDYTGLLHTIAADYSSSKTYPVVGMYAWQGGVLKRNIVPITTAETYTAAHWTNAVIGDDLSALKSALNIGLDSKTINGTVFGWANEGIRATDGYISSNSKRLRITNPIQDTIIKINTPSSCEYAIFAFTSPDAEYGTYIGWWTGTAWSKGNIVWKKGETSFDNLRAQYDYYLFIVLKDSGNADISISFASNLGVYNEFGIVFELSDKITESGNIFTDGSWEVGSIASTTGDNYDENIKAIRTKTFYYLDGITLSVANGWRGKWFKYQADGTYIGTGDWFKFGDRALLEAGYYRIILTETPTPQETTGTEWVNLFANGKFSQAVADITGEGMDCTVDGKKIDLSVQKFGVKQLYDIPWRTGVTVSNQGIDSANGTLFILWSDGYVSLVNINTGALIAAYEIESGHGNACQFSDEYYDASDDYPLLYCYDYDHRVYVNRVTTSGATLIKTYNLPIDGYRLSGGYDAVSKKLVTVHYKSDSSTSGENNYCVLSVWDLLTATENDGEYVPALVSEVKIPFIPVIQDCKYYKGLLYITSGYWSTYNYPLVIYAFDTAGNCVTKVDDFPGFMIENDYAEAEGISFYKDNDKYRMIFALHYVYELFMN